MNFDNKRTFTNYAQLARFIEEERRLGLSVYYWGLLDNFSRWYSIEELAEDACEDWFDHGESVDIYLEPSTDYKHDILKALIAEYKEVHWDYFSLEPSEKMAIDEEVDALPIDELVEFFNDKYKTDEEVEVSQETETICLEYGRLITVGEYDENFELFVSREFDKCRRA